MEGKAHENDLNLKATELTLGLPGRDETSDLPNQTKKRSLPADLKNEEGNPDAKNAEKETAPPAKEQIVGWPPIRSYRKNSLQVNNNTEAETAAGIYVKVSMDGAPYLRKIDLRVYKCYPELLKALEVMFKFTIGQYSEREGYKGSEYAPTYEDKDGDWMLVGDVPWGYVHVILQEVENHERVRSQRLGGVVYEKDKSTHKSKGEEKIYHLSLDLMIWREN